MALSFAKALIPVLACRACRTPFITRAAQSWRPLHLSSTHAQKPEGNRDLLKALDRELIFIKKDLCTLPEVASFTCSTEGAVATFTRSFGTEEITVTLDTNSGVDMDLMGGELSGSEAEEDVEAEDSTKVPAFTVTVSKPSGNKMEFECSFHPGVDDFEDLSIMIDSVAVIPKDCTSVESIYTVESDQLEKDLYEGLENYLTERGINNAFGSDLLNFYSVFEHSAYATNFLEKMKTYCSEQ